MKLILQQSSRLHLSFSLDRSAVICLETLAYCWIFAVVKACLWFNLKDSLPLPLLPFIHLSTIPLTLCEWIPMQVTPFPTEWVPWHWSFPGNLSKLLHLGLHTCTVSNIKPVGNFSPGLHSDRFEATSSVMLLLVFLPMCSYGASSWSVSGLPSLQISGWGCVSFLMSYRKSVSNSYMAPN